MDSVDTYYSQKPHAVLIPFPAQGHITPFLKLAKLFHSLHGFHITFVNTEFNHLRLLRSCKPTAGGGGGGGGIGLPDLRFETIPDGLPPSDPDLGGQFMPALMASIPKNCPSPFLDLLTKLNSPSSGVPQVTCIVCDGIMSFALDAAERIGVPGIAFWTASACGFMGYYHFDALFGRGLAPLKGEVADELLDTPIDWIPGMRNIRLRDLPSFHRPTDPGDVVFNYMGSEARRAADAMAVIVNTLDEFEHPVLEAMEGLLPPPIYAIGPINLLSRRIPEDQQLGTLGSNLWEEDDGCVGWLNDRKPGSVLYANFGSIVMVSNAQLAEFARGLASSGCDFLWVIRRDLVMGETAIVPAEFAEETRGRGLVVSWCAQEKVLAHPAVGGFLTHSGWNSALESISAGVPMICWPFLAEQMTNCRYACSEWGVGVEIGDSVKREEVAALVRNVIAGEKGKEMRKKVAEWKQSAERATGEGGPSFLNLDRLIKNVVLSSRT